MKRDQNLPQGCHPAQGQQTNSSPLRTSAFLPLPLSRSSKSPRCRGEHRGGFYDSAIRTSEGWFCMGRLCPTVLLGRLSEPHARDAAAHTSLLPARRLRSPTSSPGHHRPCQPPYEQFSLLVGLHPLSREHPASPSRGDWCGRSSVPFAIKVGTHWQDSSSLSVYSPCSLHPDI